MKKVLIILGVVIILGAGFYLIMRTFVPGGGGSDQTAPDSIKTGEPAPVKINFSVWGSGGPIKGRYTEVILYYRLVGEATYKALRSDPVPVIFTGDQQKFDGKYESYIFTIPPYPKGTNGEIEFYYEMKLDGYFNHVDGLKKIKIVSS